MLTQSSDLASERSGVVEERTYPSAGLAVGVLDAISARAIVLDADGSVLSVNRAWTQFEAAWHPRSSLGPGDNYFEVVSQLDAPERWGGSRAATGILSVLTGRRARFALDYSVVGDDGECWYELVAEPLPGGGGALLTHSDVTERKRAEESLLARALHDDLTGLPNRALLLDRIGQAMSKSARRGPSVVLMFIDLDRFKVVNDRLGHAAGDVLLTEVADRLRRAVRAGDTVGRLGGDEFLVLCEQAGGQCEAVSIAERILVQLEEPLRIGAETVYPAASIGIALDGEPDLGVDELVARADAAMYLAKGDSKRRIAVFDDSLVARTADRMQDEHDLRVAIETDQLALVFQPQFRLLGMQPCGAEAMVRWNHPDRGLLTPADFIALAEDTGLIVPLGRWVLGRICEQLAAWGDAGPLGADGRVWMNLSARELADAGLVDAVASALGRTGARAERFGIELTEAALMHYPDLASDVIGQLRELGVAVALDDFGSGNSSLTRMGRFPVGAIKLDRGFVADLDSDAVASAIAASIVALARGLGAGVIAEGIETAEQLEAVRRLGVDIVQGYLLAAPGPAERL